MHDIVYMQVSIAIATIQTFDIDHIQMSVDIVLLSCTIYTAQRAPVRAEAVES